MLRVFVLKLKKKKNSKINNLLETLKNKWVYFKEFS